MSNQGEQAARPSVVKSGEVPVPLPFVLYDHLVDVAGSRSAVTLNDSLLALIVDIEANKLKSSEKLTPWEREMFFYHVLWQRDANLTKPAKLLGIDPLPVETIVAIQDRAGFDALYNRIERSLREVVNDTIQNNIGYLRQNIERVLQLLKDGKTVKEAVRSVIERKQ